MSASYDFTVKRVADGTSLSFSIDGQHHVFNSGTLVYSLALFDVKTTYLFAGEVVFDSNNSFDLSLTHSGNSFDFSLYKGKNNPTFEFLPASAIGCSFYFFDYLLVGTSLFLS